VIEIVWKLFIQKFNIVSMDPHFTSRYAAGTHASSANKTIHGVNCHSGKALVELIVTMVGHLPGLVVTLARH